MIRVMADGNIQINGPIANKVLTLGILELAKKAVMDFNPARGGNGLVLPGPRLEP